MTSHRASNRYCARHLYQRLPILIRKQIPGHPPFTPIGESPIRAIRFKDVGVAKKREYGSYLCRGIAMAEWAWRRRIPTRRLLATGHPYLET